MNKLRDNFTKIFAREVDGERFFTVDQSFYNSQGDINISKLVNEWDSGTHTFEFYYIGDQFIADVLEYSDRFVNVKIKFENDIDTVNFEDKIISSFSGGFPLRVYDGEKYLSVIGYKQDTIKNQFILTLESGYNIDGNINRLTISEIVGISDPLSIIIEDKQESTQQNVTVLKGSRRDYFEDDYKTSDLSEKTYGDVQNLQDTLDIHDYSNIKDEINIDYSNFENHVFFGSAYSKVVSASKKIDEISRLNNFNSSSIVSNDLKRIIDNLSPYELYVFNEIWKDMNSSQFSEWVSEQMELAQDFDAKNNNNLLYAIPEHFLENDPRNLFTNFILLIGEFMDSQWAIIKSLENLYNFDISSKEITSPKIIDILLEDMGFDVDYKYTEKDFVEYFGNQKNLKRVSNEISKRLIYTLPFLVKVKGTNSSINYILNSFGIPPELLQIYEFGAIDGNENLIRYIEEYDWFVDVPESENFSMVIDSETLNQNDHTIQFVIRNLKGSSGKIIEFTPNDYISYEVTGNSYQVKVVTNGVTSYTSPVILNNDLWNFFTITRNGLTNGSFKYYTLNTISNNIIEFYEEDFTDESHTPVFNSIDIFPTGGGDITEFRWFDSTLTDSEIEYHSTDIRSTAEEDNDDTLVFRFKFYRPDDDPVSIDAMEGSYSLTSNISRDQFSKDNFFIQTIVNTTLSNMFSSSKITKINRTIESQLSSKREVTSYDNIEQIIDLPFIGIFVSPTDFYNKYLIRKLGYDTDFVLDDNTKFDFQFSNITDIQDASQRLNNNFYKENVLHNILDLFNIKVYNVLKEFLPASSKLLAGHLIKNSIIHKNKVVKRKPVAKIRKNPEIVFSGNHKNTTSTPSILKVNHSIKRLFSSNPREKIDAVIISKYNGSNSSFEIPIETGTSFKKSPWLNRAIKGSNHATKKLSPEEITDLFNNGARILVK